MLFCCWAVLNRPSEIFQTACCVCTMTVVVYTYSKIMLYAGQVIWPAYNIRAS